MKINEVSELTQMTKRAIKYYEEKGLLHISKKGNGYRDYQWADVERLKEISLYRKLDIPLSDIEQILRHPSQKTMILKEVYAHKQKNLKEEHQRLSHLYDLIQNDGRAKAIQELEPHLAYRTIAQAFSAMLPGMLGQYFLQHFLPYLQFPMTTSQQKEAYHKILSFLDDLDLKPTWMMRCSSFLFQHSKIDMLDLHQTIHRQIQDLLYLNEEQYEQYKAMVIQQVKKRQRWIYRYHPCLISQRRFMKRLQDCGYYDILIPNMKLLSPSYKEYHDALSKFNERICLETGIHYDTNYHIID